MQIPKNSNNNKILNKALIVIATIMITEAVNNNVFKE